MPRFVILRHEVPSHLQRPSHWDLMLEGDWSSSGENDPDHQSGLLTWAVERLPTGSGVVPAQHLANHRLAYLDYEGPVAGGRGTVRRWDAGRMTWIAHAEDFLQARVVGIRWVGMIRLRRLAEEHSSDLSSKQSSQRWLLDFAADE